MTATRRPAPESTISTPASDTLWSTTFAALSPLRQDAVSAHLRGESTLATAERLGRTTRDVVALRDSSFVCWGALASAAGAGGSLPSRLADGVGGLRRADRRLLARALPAAAPAAADRRRGVLIAVAVTGSVSLAGVVAAVVVHEGRDGSAASTGGAATSEAAASTPGLSEGSSAVPGSPVDTEPRAARVITGGLLAPATPGAGVREPVPAGAGSTGTDGSSTPGGSEPGAPGEPGDPGDPPADGPGVDIGTDPAGGHVRIVLRLPGADPIVIETPTVAR